MSSDWVEICTFLRSCKTYVEAGARGPDVAVMARDHCVLDHFGGEELVIHIALPGHGEGGAGVWCLMIRELQSPAAD